VHIGIYTIKVGAFIYPEEYHAREISSEYPDQIKEGREQGEADYRGCDPRTDKIPLGVDPHGIEGVDLLGDTEDTDFGCHCRTRPGGYHNRRKDRAEFPDEREGYDRTQYPLRAEFYKGIVELQPEDHTGTEADEHHDIR